MERSRVQMSDTQLLERETEAAQPQQPRRRWGVVPLAIVLGVVALFVVIGMSIVSAIRGVVDSVPTPSDLAAVFEPEPYEEIGPVVISSIRDLANLTTIEVVEYTIVEKGTDEGWLSWARGDSLQLFAVAKIGAGVDLDKVTVRDVTLGEDGVVELSVPAAEIQYVAVDNEASQILDRETGLFTKGDPQLETEARQVADEVLVQGALDDGLLADAEANAQEVLTDFLLGLGYRDVIVEFKP
jgi:hypothetical protein